MNPQLPLGEGGFHKEVMLELGLRSEKLLLNEEWRRGHSRQREASTGSNLNRAGKRESLKVAFKII